MRIKNNSWVEPLVFGIILLMIYGFMAYWTVFELRVFAGDAAARTFNAKLVLFSRLPKLANVGFVWAPMPAILQIPLTLVPFFRTWTLSGNILTAIMGVGNALLILQLLKKTRVTAFFRWLITAAYAFNPYIILYSINGMSENTLIFFSLGSVVMLHEWLKNQSWVALSGMSFLAALAALSRYDGLFVAGFEILVVAVLAFFAKRDKPAYAENVIWLAATPIVYGFALWIFLNYTIMGDPLFFQHSDLSLALRLGGLLRGREWIMPLKLNIVESVKMVFLTIFQLAPHFWIFSVPLLILAIIKKEWNWLGIWIASLGLIVFTFVNIFLGHSQYSTRYFISAIPMGLICLVGILDLTHKRQWLLVPLSLILLSYSGYSAFLKMQEPDPFDNDHVFLSSWITQTPANIFSREITLAQFIDFQTSGDVLVDGFQGNQVMVFSNELSRYVTNYDEDFIQRLNSPKDNAEYILVNKPTLYLDEVNRVYPALFDNGGGWVELSFDAGDWRLYRVIGKPGSDMLLDPKETLQLQPK